MELAQELDPETARYIEYLLMEIKVNHAILLDDFAKLKKKLPYDEVLTLLARISVQSSLEARHHQELDRALDRILVLAPDVEEG
jgi:hypothetical protein